jgi:hypothetical protein
MYLANTTAEIDFAAFTAELSEMQRAIDSFLTSYNQGQDVKPHFEVLIRQLNFLADLYS